MNALGRSDLGSRPGPRRVRRSFGECRFRGDRPRSVSERNPLREHCVRVVGIGLRGFIFQAREDLWSDFRASQLVIGFVHVNRPGMAGVGYG